MLSRHGGTFVPSPPAPLSARDGAGGGVGGRGSTQKSAEPRERNSPHRNSLRQPGMAFPCPPTLDALLGQHWKDLQEGFSDYDTLNRVLEFQSDELQWTSQKWACSGIRSGGLGGMACSPSSPGTHGFVNILPSTMYQTYLSVLESLTPPTLRSCQWC
ncbi:hypothetical protein SKAU_G00256590 [Synaphobranchus kaupii]|uniref:Uncharacterized protein n=1 Tax=Synaphobranchus kaupii TaxID=118154 RepID=A0A9Q1F410_SYNKA|nr:hypothetical protein SKAU_G00256590 [Synaphobranchus kaupii]